jgi:5-methyltetrahydrofolate--homocysteine methyltransferase
MSSSLLQMARERTLLCDGAMGTCLTARGLSPGSCGEVWNVDRPDVVLDIQNRYVAAGSDCLLTNTFGANRLMLERLGESDRLSAINVAAVRIARQAFGARQGFVIGDLGSLGGLIEPYGEHTKQRVRESFREQLDILIGAGIDAIVLETQTVYEEIEIGVEEAREAGAPCVIVSMAFDTMRDGSEIRTMMGNTPSEAATFLDGLGVDVLGINCGAGINMRWVASAIADYKRVSSRPVMAKPNAGTPALVDMIVEYPYSPEVQAQRLPELLETGVSLVGGCCGTTPEHIRAFRAVIDASAPPRVQRGIAVERQ